MDLLYIIRSILALIFIIWLANILLRKLSYYMKGQTPSIEVIEKYSVSKNSSLAIVKIVNSYYLMSFNEDKNEILKEFTVAEVYEIVESKKMGEESDPISREMWTDLPRLKEKYYKILNREQDE